MRRRWAVTLKRVSNLNLRQDLAAASVTCILPSIVSCQLKKSTVVVMRHRRFHFKYTNYVKEWGGGFLFVFLIKYVLRPPGTAEGAA